MAADLLISTTKMKYIYSSGAEKSRKDKKKQIAQLPKVPSDFSLQMVLPTKVLLKISLLLSSNVSVVVDHDDNDGDDDDDDDNTYLLQS